MQELRGARARRPRWRAGLVGLCAAAALAAPAAALELGEADDFSNAVVLLQLPSDLRRVKIRESKEQFAWSFTSAALVGYDGNPNQAPSVDGAGMNLIGARAELRRHLTRDDWFKVTAMGTFTPYWQDGDDLSEWMQQGTLRYTHRFSRKLRAGFYGAVQHENDHATNIDGVALDRDFEYISFRMKPHVSWKLGSDNRFRLAYEAKRKDYAETSGLESLDWWRHGVGVEYERKIGETAEVGLEFDFDVQLYDDEPAALPDGTEPPGAPDEEHYFYIVEANGSWQLLPWLQLSGGYRLRIKDDQFRDFESYVSNLGEIGLLFRPLELLSIDVMGSYERRNYDKRLADTPGSELHYDRYRVRTSVHQGLGEHLALVAQYDFALRDSNRSVGTSFRSYERHRVLAGVQLAY
jgi:hypothetical protein